MEKKYTYSEWLNGDVQLDSCRLEYIKDNLPSPIITSIENFKNTDIEKIHSHQAQIFNEAIFIEIENYRVLFKKKYCNSKLPQILIENEIIILRELTSGKFICEKGICKSARGKMEFEEWYYDAMQAHIRICLVNGLINSFDSIPSPNSPYVNHSAVLPEIRIEAIFKMINFLIDLKTKQVNKRGKVQIYSRTQSRKKEPRQFSIEQEFLENHREYFRYLNDYEFFLKLKNNLPTSSLSGDEKYSYIFHRLKSKRMIKAQVRHRYFIEYLNSFHSANIKNIKFRECRFSKRNELIFDLLFRDFKENKSS